jgi:hypothetical protein
MPTLKDYQAKTLAPGWLQDPAGLAFLGALGARKDALVALAKEAVKARLPTFAPDDALAEIGRDRDIERGPGEPDASYRARLRIAHDTWRWAGTAYGILLELYNAGYTPISGRVVIQTQKGKQHELRADFDPTVHGPDGVVTTDLGTVHLGGSPELWSQFAVLFVNPIPARWTPTVPADGGEEVERIRRIIRSRKPAHARCVRLTVSPGTTWGLNMTWGSFTWGGGGAQTVWTPPAG